MSPIEIRPITAEDDEAMGAIARANLKAFGLDIPGTAYFDPELMRLSVFYDAAPDKRAYFVAVDETGTVLGGGGLAESDLLDNTAELQKLYLSDAAKGHGLGTRLMGVLEDAARQRGYARFYLETHSNLKAAIHLYDKLGYQRCEAAGSAHTAMDHFFIKEL